MAEETALVGDLFGVRSKEWRDAVHARVEKEISTVKWTAGLPDVVEKIAGVFDIKVPAVLIGGWRKADEIRKALAESEKNPADTTFVEMAEHTVKSVHHPSVTLEVKGVVVGKLEFTVDVSFTLKGVILKLQQGEITQIQTGSCEAQGKILCGTLELATKKLEPIKLPGTIDLAIARQEAARAGGA